MNNVLEYIENKRLLETLEKKSDALMMQDDFDVEELNSLTDDIEMLQEKIEYLETIPEVEQYIQKKESKEAEEYKNAQKVIIEHHHFREKTIEQAYEIVSMLERNDSKNFIPAVGAFKEVFDKDYFKYQTQKEKEQEQQRKQQQMEQKQEDEKRKSRRRAFWIVGIFVIAGLFVAIPSKNTKTVDKPKQEQSEVEDYNDNSKKHQDDAYFAVKHKIQENLKDADSYEIVSYLSEYNETEKCYQVSVKYKAKNGFGAVVTEMVKAAVEYDTDGNAIVTDMLQLQ